MFTYGEEKYNFWEDCNSQNLMNDHKKNTMTNVLICTQCTNIEGLLRLFNYHFFFLQKNDKF